MGAVAKSHILASLPALSCPSACLSSRPHFDLNFFEFPSSGCQPLLISTSVICNILISMLHLLHHSRRPSHSSQALCLHLPPQPEYSRTVFKAHQMTTTFWRQSCPWSDTPMRFCSFSIVKADGGCEWDRGTRAGRQQKTSSGKGGMWPLISDQDLIILASRSPDQCSTRSTLRPRTCLSEQKTLPKHVQTVQRSYHKMSNNPGGVVIWSSQFESSSDGVRRVDEPD